MRREYAILGSKWYSTRLFVSFADDVLDPGWPVSRGEFQTRSTTAGAKPESAPGCPSTRGRQRTIYGHVEMIRLLAALRAMVYMAGFLLLWGWLALQLRSVRTESRLPAEVRVGGIILMVLGGVLVVACVAWFVMVGRGTPAPFDAPRSFVPGGPYRWVRNPMYLGAAVLLVGFGLWHRSLPMALFAIPALALAHVFVVLYEEPTLRQRFGLAYVTYLGTVNRWIPKPPTTDRVDAS